MPFISYLCQTKQTYPIIYMKKIISLVAFLTMAFTSYAQTSEQVLETARKANNYFMAKYDDPTKPTFVRKIRPSSLWTRAVYYEGLMELHAIDPDKAYIDYAKTWADFHQWTPRNGVKTTDADDQCCGQTYYMLLPYCIVRVLPICRVLVIQLSFRVQQAISHIHADKLPYRSKIPPDLIPIDPPISVIIPITIHTGITHILILFL